MSEMMLHGVLNMPMPDDPSDMGVVEWAQFQSAAREASARIATLEAQLPAAYAMGRDDAATVLQTKQTHMYTTPNDEVVQIRTRSIAEMAQMVRALPIPDAADLAARAMEKEPKP